MKMSSSLSGLVVEATDLMFWPQLSFILNSEYNYSFFLVA
jgi:hypothetical protein